MRCTWALLALLTNSCCAVRLSTVPNPSRLQLCGRSRQVVNGTLSVRSVLVGAHLTIGTGRWDEFYWRQDAKTGELSGFEIDILEELSQRASFKYDLVLMNTSNFTSYTDFGLRAVKQYDMVTWGYWVVTPERLAMGAFSPGQTEDGSYVYLTRGHARSQPFWTKMIQFSRPFTRNVWLIVVGVLVGTGVLYWYIEGATNDEDFGSKGWCIKAELSVTKSMLQFTGGGGFAPNSWPGRILLVSWSWCILLVTAAYTANLATFLIAKGAPISAFESIEDAVAKDRIVCSERGLPAVRFFEQSFPNYGNFRASFVKSDDLLRSLVSGECDVIIQSFNNWQIWTHTPQLEGRCSMQIMGQPLARLQAGYLVYGDYSRKCTVLARDALAIHLAEMSQDGTLKAVRTRWLEKLGKPCQRHVKEQLTEESPLDAEAMSGIFLMHALGSLLALAIFWAHKFVRRFPRCPGRDDDQEPIPEEPRPGRCRRRSPGPERGDEHPAGTTAPGPPPHPQWKAGCKRRRAKSRLARRGRRSPPASPVVQDDSDGLLTI